MKVLSEPYDLKTALTRIRVRVARNCEQISSLVHASCYHAWRRGHVTLHLHCWMWFIGR